MNCNIIYSTIIDDVFNSEEYAEKVARENIMMRDVENADITEEMIADEVRQMMDSQFDTFQECIKIADENRRYDNIMYLITADIGTWNGRCKGGKIFTDLESAFYAISKDIDDFKVIEDWRGGIVVYGYHHDGMNMYKIREITPEGIKYVENHWYFSPEVLHEKIANNSKYSRNPHLRKLFGFIC